VGISFGMLYFPHPERALAEAFRALQPGGRIAFTVRATPDKAVGFAIVLKAIEAHGRTDVPLPSGTPFFRFSDWEESRRTLLNAGFVQPDARDVDQTQTLRAPETPFHVLMHGGVRVAAMLNAKTPSALELIERAVARDAETYWNDAGELRNLATRTRNREEQGPAGPCLLSAREKARPTARLPARPDADLLLAGLVASDKRGPHLTQRQLGPLVWVRATLSWLDAKQPQQHPPVNCQRKHSVAIFRRDDMDQPRFM
jgi:hypothetical protein